MLIDSVDRELLLCLLREGRVQTKILAERVGLSAPAAAERVRRLESAGVIAGYSARVDLTKLGYPVQAFARVSAQADQGDALLNAFSRTLEVVEVYKVTGEDSYLLRLVAQSVAHLQAIIEGLSLGVRLSTSIVLAEESQFEVAMEKLLSRSMVKPRKQSNPDC